MQRKREAQTRPTRSAALLAGLALGLGGCIGGGGGGGGSLAGGGMSGTGITYGPVDAFGSIIVNGKRYDTDDAAITLADGTPGTQADLERGMLVRVDWTSDNRGRRAGRVEFDYEVIGPVEDFDAATGTFSVLGQTVEYGNRTRFDDCAGGLASNGDVVQISGWTLDGDGGAFRASYVHCVERDDGEYEIEGPIQDLDNPAGTFRIGSLTVNYVDPPAEIDDDVDPLTNGRYVEVEGTFEEGVFIAREIDDEDDDRLRGDDDDEVEFQGTITEMTPDGEARTFRVNGVTVQVDAGTEFDDGLRGFGDLAAGLLVAVEGNYIGDRRVRAEEIELGDGEVELDAMIERAPDGDPATFIIGGIRVRTTDATIVVDDDDRRVDVDRLRALEWVEVEGTRREDDDGEAYLEASLIERDDDDDDDEYEYEGPLDAVNTVTPASITVIGLEIFVDSAEFDDTSIDDLANALAGDERVRVEVEYRDDGGTYRADEVEREDDD